MTLWKSSQQIIDEYGLLPLAQLPDGDKLAAQALKERGLNYSRFSHGLVQKDGTVLLLRPSGGG